MAIDLLQLEPTKISRDLKGKFVCLYGEPGVGKTSLAVSFPKNLLLGFEHGWNAQSNIFAVDIPNWREFKLYIKQLAKPELKERFNTISIDTIGLAWDRCVEFICDKNGVDKIGEIPYGAGYAEASKEFEDAIVKITQLGYGIVIIAHSDVHMEADPENENTEVKVLGPAIPKRAYNIVNRLVDIIAYIGVDKAGSRWLYLRSTPTITAKSRFRYTPPRIPMSYDELVNAIANAIEEEANNGGAVTDAPIAQPVEEPQLDFKKIVAEIKKYAKKLYEEERTDEYNKIVAEYLGKNRGVKDCDESQIDMLVLILDDLRDLMGKE